MGTYLLGTIYDVIAPFLLEMGENVPIENVPIENVPIENVPIENVPIENDQHEICFVSVFFASL